LNTADKLDAVKSLLRHPAWPLIVETIRSENYALATKFSSPGFLINGDDMHFYRGAIHTAELFASMPDRLVQKLTTDLLIEQAAEAAKAKKTASTETPR
jgi:hypothetical protein